MVKLLINGNHFLIIFKSTFIIQFLWLPIQVEYVNSKSIASIKMEQTRLVVKTTASVYGIDSFDDNRNLSKKSSNYDDIGIEDYKDSLKLDTIKFNSKKIIKLSTSSNLLSKNPKTSHNSSSIHASSVTSHYQVINICNTLPSILKCQNKHHFIIMHRVIHGISDSKDKNECSFKTSCYQVDENDYYNCTGSNMCVFNPIDRFLHTCERVKSNLTQVHITCVSLSHLKKFYLQKNKKFESGNLETSLVNVTDHYTTENMMQEKRGMLLNVINANTSSSNASKTDLKISSTIFWDSLNLSHNSLILISITIFSSLVATILISLIYYRIKIKQLMNATSIKRNKSKKNNIDSSMVMNASINSNSLSSIAQIPPPPPGFENSIYGQNEFLNLSQQYSYPNETDSQNNKNEKNKNKDVKFNHLKIDFEKMQNIISNRLNMIRKIFIKKLSHKMIEKKKIENQQKNNVQVMPKIILREKQQGQTTTGVQEQTSIIIDFNSRRLESSTDFDYNLRHTDFENDNFHSTDNNQIQNDCLQFKTNYFNNDLYGSNLTNNIKILNSKISNKNFAFTSRWLSKRSGIIMELNDEKPTSSNQNIENYNLVNNIKYLNKNSKHKLTEINDENNINGKNNIVYSTLKANQSSSQSSSPISSTPESSPLTSPSSSTSDAQSQSESTNLIPSSSNNQVVENIGLYSFYHPFVGINFNHILYDIPEEEADLDNFEYDPKKNSNFC